MQLANYEPWSVFQRFGRLYDDLHRNQALEAGNKSPAGRWTPAVDVREEETRYVIEVDVPGVEAKDIEVTADAGQLVIQGSRAQHTDEDKAGFRRIERVRGSFLRSFQLPELANAERIEASSRDGVLTVTIGKLEEAQSRRIPVS